MINVNVKIRKPSGQEEFIVVGCFQVRFIREALFLSLDMFGLSAGGSHKHASVYYLSFSAISTI
jgi:hypothetical protein